MKQQNFKRKMDEFIDWNTEATAVINDVKELVKNIEISEKLISDGSCIYINVRQRIIFLSNFDIFFINQMIKIYFS